MCTSCSAARITIGRRSTSPTSPSAWASGSWRSICSRPSDCGRSIRRAPCPLRRSPSGPRSRSRAVTSPLRPRAATSPKAMHPELFRALGISFPAYFVLLVTGFLFATAAGALWARRVGENPDVVVDLGIAMLLSGVAGGRLLHVFADGYFSDYVNLCLDPSKVDWALTKADCLSASYDGVWDAAKGVCHP